MKSFKCLCLKCTLLLLLVLRSPHVSSVCMGVTVFPSLQHPDKKKPFFFLSPLADCSFLLSLVQLKKKSLFSQCIPTGTLQKCFFYWSCRPDVCDCACLSVSVWKNKMSSLVRAGAFFFTACSLACVNGCHLQHLSQIRPPVDAFLCFLHSFVFVSSLGRPARSDGQGLCSAQRCCVRTSAAL